MRLKEPQKDCVGVPLFTASREHENLLNCKQYLYFRFLNIFLATILELQPVKISISVLLKGIKFYNT